MRDEALYLADIIEAAEAIGRFTIGRSEDDWLEDELRQSAVMHQLIVIGEAAARLSKELRDRHSEIEWADIVGFRNFAVHAYFAVSWPVVWVTATQDVPILAAQIARVLAEDFPIG
jgi:uncharacterized protein with HEPN domain